MAAQAKQIGTELVNAKLKQIKSLRDKYKRNSTVIKHTGELMNKFNKEQEYLSDKYGHPYYSLGWSVTGSELDNRSAWFDIYIYWDGVLAWTERI